MANIASSKKDARRSAVRAQRNRAIKSSVKTRITRVRRGLSEGAEQAGELAERAISSLDRAVSKGVLHRNNAARRKSRLAKRLNAASVETPAAATTTTKKAPAKAASKPAAKATGSRTASKAAAKPSTRKKS